jgi:Na+-transporting methylmalonyl-CoA/oxaloacetate decarboxylase beta subunit
MSFTTSSFWLSLYMQNVLKFSALGVAVHLLPTAIGGILVNIVAGLILHRVSNKLLTGIGALSYLATMKEDSSYWAFIFPSLIFCVIGADLQFNVANVGSRPPHLTLADDLDVCDVFSASCTTIASGWHLQHG